MQWGESALIAIHAVPPSTAISPVLVFTVQCAARTKRLRPRIPDAQIAIKADAR
jgi:hypothetical protein